MNKETVVKRSPLRERPLRYAGQSVDEQIDQRFDNVTIYLFCAGIFATVAVVEWLWAFTKAPVNPWVITGIAFLVILYSSVRIWRIKQIIEALKLGRDGEKIVAENLDDLKRDGATVLHDIVGNSFNIDHVVCSRRGIFLVETKTRTKAARRNPTIIFDMGREFS
jgi:hypothetical protein